MKRFFTAAGTALLWVLWAVCVLAVIPVLINVPGKATPVELGLYFAVLGVVGLYPLVLPALAVLEREARKGSTPTDAVGYRWLCWGAFALTGAVLSVQLAAFYVHAQALPALSREERFTNVYSNAILYQDTAWMDRLMAEGASVDHAMPRGHTPALLGASFGDWTVVEFLLGRGADPDRVDGQGRSVRDYATTPKYPPRDPREAQALARVRVLLNQTPRRANPAPAPAA